ncbi:hypothetical protein BU17DRAFT_70826 [Hysterangium stoloniferum]|nr:hypothetical protein BU17DRAFT_70826 [Hysterangium stoloniferum]
MTMGSGSKPFPSRPTVTPISDLSGPLNAQEHQRLPEEKKKACEEEECKEREELKVIEVEEKRLAEEEAAHKHWEAELAKKKQREADWCKVAAPSDFDDEEDGEDEEEVPGPSSPKKQKWAPKKQTSIIEYLGEQLKQYLEVSSSNEAGPGVETSEKVREKEVSVAIGVGEISEAGEEEEVVE